MTSVPASVDFLKSAASSAAKARLVPSAIPTQDSLDVATALKCLTVFHTKREWEDLARFDDETYAAPLVAAARTLQSTAQHRKMAPEPADQDEIDELYFFSSLAYAMHGNFPSAKAVIGEVSPQFLGSSPTFRMAAIVCDTSRAFAQQPQDVDARVDEFRQLWAKAMSRSNRSERLSNLADALTLFRNVARYRAMLGKPIEGAIVLHVRMAAHQASRLATANLLESTPEIPHWFVSNAIHAGMPTLLPPQRQLLCEKHIAGYSGNMLLTLPTSTGKTFVAEACMAASLTKGGLSVYVAPYVAVGEQVRAALERHFRGIPIVPMFGGFRMDSAVSSSHSEVIVATPERFDAWLRAGQGIDRLRTVVFDEIHVVENGARGARLEGLISRMRLLQASNTDLKLLGLSAVLSEPALVCSWLGVDPKALHQIGWRPTARRLALCLSDGNMFWVHGNDALRPPGAQPDTLLSGAAQFQLQPLPFNAFQGTAEASTNVARIAQDLLARLGSPGLVVCPRKSDTRILSRALAAGNADIADPTLIAVADSIVARYAWLDRLAQCVRRGIAYHNASLPYEVRRDIEELTRQRKLRVVCSTTTLAEGADLPFRWTIVSHYLMSLRDEGKPMKSMTFRNIAGRCGRAGSFAEGDTILFENVLGPRSAQRGGTRPRPTELTKVMFSSSPLESTIGSGWEDSSDAEKDEARAAFAAQLMACIGEHPTMEAVVAQFMQATYAQYVGGRERLVGVLEETLTGMLDDSRPGGALAVANSPVRLTEFGVAANRSGFSPETCRLMVSFLSSDNFFAGAKLYADLLRRFGEIPEQAQDAVRKIVRRKNHRHPIRDQHLELVIEDLLVPFSLRDAFERQRARATPASTAGEDYVDAQFDKFVSFATDVVGHFLPWLLRGLQTLSQFGSAHGHLADWSGHGRYIESQLQRASNADRADDGAEAEFDDL